MKYFKILYSWRDKQGAFLQCDWVFVMGESEEGAVCSLKPEEHQIFEKVNYIEEMTKEEYDARMEEIKAGELCAEKLARLSKILVGNNDIAHSKRMLDDV